MRSANDTSKVPGIAQPAVLRGLTGALAPQELAQFAELLAGLVRAKLPLPDALRLMGRDAENRRLRAVLAVVEKDVAGGLPLAEALRRHGGEFPDVFVRLIEQGCAANDLHAALIELVREYRSQARFREALWSQLLGPIMTAAVGGAVLLLLVAWNIPEAFRGIFAALHVNLPLPTVLALKVSALVRTPGFIASVVLIVLGVVAVVAARWRQSRLRVWVQTMALKLPVLGPYLRSLMLAQFCRLSSILLRRKLPLDASLALTANSLSFVPLREAVERVGERAGSGTPLVEALEGELLFPPTFCHFVRGAQTHGDLPETLSRLAEMYEERADLQGARLRLLIYVLAVLVVGGGVLWMMLSCFLPIFKIQEALQHK